MNALREVNQSPSDERSSEINAPADTVVPQRTSRKRFLLLVLAVVVFLGPSMFGFVTKFIEFFVLFRGEADGVFAITPICNYLLASLGFMCLLGWAALRGMFADIEAPKRTMLEIENRLDAWERLHPQTLSRS